MPILQSLRRITQIALRALLSYHVANGVSAALGLLLISGSVHYFLGSFAAAAASVGVVVCIPPDQPAPKRGKFWQLLPAALLGLPLFFAVQALHSSPLYLGLLLVPATFVAFLAAAWGKRGLPISISIMFAMIFSMAMPRTAGTETALASSLYFGLGEGLYLMYATLANSLLNRRYRVQMLADTLLSLAQLLRTQAQQFTQIDNAAREALLGQILQQQAMLTDHMQTARDIVLEAPTTPSRQRIAGMLLHVLEMRDHLLVCELDLEILHSKGGHGQLLADLRNILELIANDIDKLADAILSNQQPAPIADRRNDLINIHPREEATVTTNILARGLAGRINMLNDEAAHLIKLARDEAKPDLALINTTWQVFVSPIRWSWQPLSTVKTWNAPPLRHALRAALAIGTAYALSLALPWGTHDYWILLTIVVVLRGSLAQTLERRNSRIAGTLAGCMLAGIILWTHPSSISLLIILTLAQAIAHAFAAKRYWITAISATVLGLLQANMLATGGSPIFEMLERIADTLIGVAIAWPFIYLLPSWERTQIPNLVTRTLTAQARHARLALALGQTNTDNKAELEWRLARREAYTSLSALVQAAQRAIVEPRAVQPPLANLEHLLAHSYQLLAQLTIVKTMLLMRQERLQLHELQADLVEFANTIETTLAQPSPETDQLKLHTMVANELPDPFQQDLSPWLRRRLVLAANLAQQTRADADNIFKASTTPTNSINPIKN